VVGALALTGKQQIWAIEVSHNLDLIFFPWWI
jgi:hypothetical protein